MTTTFRSRVFAALLLAASVAFAQDAAKKESGIIVVRAARLFDGTGAAPIQNVAVIIDGNRIRSISRDGTVPRGAQLFDLGDATILPGLIDAHTHLVGRTLDDPEATTAVVRDYPSFAAILSVANAEKTLRAGFTTVRNVGAAGFDDLALKKAIDEGRVTGPRIIASGHSLGITGGHCDNNAFRPGLIDRGVREGIANGPDEVRAAVRYQVKYGAGVIKTCATGGVLSEGDAVGTTQYTFEEMKAIVDEAANHERRVAAHAHGAEGIKISTRAGVASIEHGSFLDDEGARLMAERGTYLVPTLVAGEGVERAAESGILKGLRAEKARAAAAAMRKGIRIAVRHNVPIAFGTDAGVVPHGSNAREFQLLVEWGGLSPTQAILTATANAARLLGMSDEIGTIAPGRFADVVVFAGDPLRDVTLLQRAPLLVIKDGEVVVRPPSR